MAPAIMPFERSHSWPISRSRRIASALGSSVSAVVTPLEVRRSRPSLTSVRTASCFSGLLSQYMRRKKTHSIEYTRRGSLSSSLTALSRLGPTSRSKYSSDVSLQFGSQWLDSANTMTRFASAGMASRARSDISGSRPELLNASSPPGV